MDLRDKKILVTGGNGFLGRHVVRNLIEKRGVPAKNIIIPRSTEHDLAIQSEAEKVIQGIDVVIHLAALSVSVASAIGPATVLYRNTVMGLNLLEASRKADVKKFVSIGSANEYPHNAPMPLKEESLWTGMPDSGLFAYSISKKVMDLAVQSYQKEFGFKAIHLIMTSMYGPGAGNASGLVPTLIRQIRKAKEEGLSHIVGWGSGNATRDFLYVKDAAEGIVLAAEAYDKDGAVNIATGREAPVRELMETLCRLMSFEGGIQWDPTKPEGQLRYVLDATRAKAEFGFEAATSLQEGLKATVAEL